MKVIGTSTTATWTSATAADTAATLDVSNYAGALITYTKTGTVSAGTIVFEFSDDDGTTWYTIEAVRLSSFASETSYTLTTGSASWIVNCPGATDFRLRLSVEISGAGSAGIRMANLAVVTPFPGSGGSGGGDASAENQTTIIGHIDGVEGLLTTIDADTGGIATSAATIAAAIKAEDAASTNGDSGMVIYAIRKATPANQSGTDGDYEPLQVSAGRLWTSTTVTSGTLTSISTVGECSDVRQSVPSRLQGQVQGTETIDSVILGAPVAIGAYASGDPTDSTVDTAGDLQYLKTDLNGRLWVTADTSAPVNVTGSVTANAGTNLNTSLLALESGGNLAGAATSLAVIDDWDETDRCKVNLIAGQAGITAGAGSVAANTPRVTHASDDPVTTALQIMDDWDESDRCKVNLIVGQAGVAADVGATSATTQRVVQANGAGKTILSAGGSVASSGNNTLIAAGTNRLKVFAFSLSTTSTTSVTCIFQSGASGTELWRVVLQAVSGANTGANLSVTPPAWLFATGSATLLNLNLSSAQTVHWSAAYYDEA